jgi:hypothetical protein
VYRDNDEAIVDKAPQTGMDHTCFMLDRMVFELQGRLNVELVKCHPDHVLVDMWRSTLATMRHDRNVLRGEAAGESEPILAKYALALRLRCSPVMRADP